MFFISSQRGVADNIAFESRQKAESRSKGEVSVKNDAKKVKSYEMKLYSKLPDVSKPTQTIKHTLKVV